MLDSRFLLFHQSYITKHATSPCFSRFTVTVVTGCVAAFWPKHCTSNGDTVGSLAVASGAKALSQRKMHLTANHEVKVERMHQQGPWSYTAQPGHGIKSHPWIWWVKQSFCSENKVITAKSAHRVYDHVLFSCHPCHPLVEDLTKTKMPCSLSTGLCKCCLSPSELEVRKASLQAWLCPESNIRKIVQAFAYLLITIKTVTYGYIWWLTLIYACVMNKFKCVYIYIMITHTQTHTHIYI